MIGLEPTNGGTTTHCLDHLATPAILLLHNFISFIESLSISILKIKSIMIKFFLNGESYTIYNNQNNLMVKDILIYFNYKNKIFVIEHNNKICNKRNWIIQEIKNNDKIEIISIVGGG